MVCKIWGPGHSEYERFDNQDEMLNHYKKYYGENVNLDTIIKMIDFSLKRKL